MFDKPWLNIEVVKRKGDIVAEHRTSRIHSGNPVKLPDRRILKLDQVFSGQTANVSSETMA